MLRRPTSSADRKASSAASGSRRRTCRALVTCSMTAASPCPTKSWTSRAMRRRSSCSAWSASSSRVRSSWSASSSCRASVRPITQGKTMPRIQIPTASSDGSWITLPTTGDAVASRPNAIAVESDRDQRPMTKPRSEMLNSSGSSCPARWANTTGITTASESTGRGTPGVYAHNAKATTGIAARTRSAVEAGSVIVATTATASAKIGTMRRCSSACDHA